MNLRVWFDPNDPTNELLADRQVIGDWPFEPFRGNPTLIHCDQRFTTPDQASFCARAFTGAKLSGKRVFLQLSEGEKPPRLVVNAEGQLAVVVATGQGGYIHLEVTEAPGHARYSTEHL